MTVPAPSAPARPAGEIALVVTDLDGTLWDGRERIHDRTLDAWHALAGRGVGLLVATGRRPRSAVETLARSGLAAPLVALDGALGIDLGTSSGSEDSSGDGDPVDRALDGARRFHTARFAPDAAARVLAAFRERGVEPCAYVDRPDVDVLIGPAPSTSPRHLEHIGPRLGHGDLDRVVDGGDVLAFGVLTNPAAGLDAATLDAVADAVRARSDAAATVTRDRTYDGAGLMVRRHGVSKWEGVLAWCADRGVDPNRVLAVGDGENDVELLAGAAVACVVADGCDAALALADHVVAPAGEGGWAEILAYC